MNNTDTKRSAFTTHTHSFMMHSLTDPFKGVLAKAWTRESTEQFEPGYIIRAKDELLRSYGPTPTTFSGSLSRLPGYKD